MVVVAFRDVLLQYYSSVISVLRDNLEPETKKAYVYLICNLILVLFVNVCLGFPPPLSNARGGY